MAEFLTLEEGKSHFGSTGKTNAGLTLGIIGTALGAMNSGILGGNGILGGWNRCTGTNAALTGAAAGVLGAEMTKEINDQEFDLWEMGKLREEALRNTMFARERDIAEKSDIYRQSKSDNNRLEDKISGLKDFTVHGLADVYQASVAENRVLERQISGNKLEAYKNVSDLYTGTVKADKDLELKIERNREKDQEEKFSLYKDLSDKSSALAYATMKQSYEDRIESMNQVNALAARVCALEKDQAVTSAQLPLMFQLTDSNTKSAINNATCRKMDGQLTIGANQISSPFIPCVQVQGPCGCNNCNSIGF